VGTYELVSTSDLGLVTITATQPGNTDYLPATVTQTFNVVKGLWPIYANQTIIPFGAPTPAFTYMIGDTTGAQGAIGGLALDRFTGVPALSSVYVPGSTAGGTPCTTQYWNESQTAKIVGTCFPIVITPGTLTSKWYNWQLNNGTLQVFPAGYFIMTTSDTAVSIPRGQARQITLAMTPENDFTGTITVSCSGLPAGVTCQLNPSTVSFSDSGAVNLETLKTTLTISAGAQILSSQNRPEKNHLLSANSLVLASGLFALPLLFFRKRLARNGLARFFILSTALLFGFSGLSACNSSNVAASAVPGTTVVTVTATGSSYTTVTPQTFQLSVTIE
jgi:hypothetical protein